MDGFRPRPLRLADLRAYRRNLEASKHRVLVEGMRGKSGLVATLYQLLRRRGVRVLGKITGLEPKIFYDGRVIEIDRGPDGRFFLDEENVGIIAGYPAEVYVAENQAITRLTMRHVHRIYKPDILVVPNVRYEHMEGLGDTIEEIAESFALGFEGANHVVYAKSTEKYDQVVERIFREHADRKGVDLKVAEIPASEARIPAAERVHLAREILRLVGHRITPKEEAEIRRAIVESLKPAISPWGFEWFDASKVNDPESTDLILEYLLKRTKKEIFILAYFRKDRTDRIVAFADFFRRAALNPRIKHVWVAGHHYRLILRALRGKASPIRAWEDTRKAVERVAREDGLLFLAVNGVTPFMDRVRDALEAGPPG